MHHLHIPVIRNIHFSITSQICKTNHAFLVLNEVGSTDLLNGDSIVSRRYRSTLISIERKVLRFFFHQMLIQLFRIRH